LAEGAVEQVAAAVEVGFSFAVEVDFLAGHFSTGENQGDGVAGVVDVEGAGGQAGAFQVGFFVSPTDVGAAEA